MTGHNSIKMTDLSALYKDLGFTDAETYIQSGNVIFSSEDELSVPDISLKIEKAILERFNCNVPVMIRTVEEMRKLISANPFLTEENFDPSKMAVIFLHEKPSEAQIQKVVNIDYPPDKFKIIGREIYHLLSKWFWKNQNYTQIFSKRKWV